jgi:HEAT repeat protein
MADVDLQLKAIDALVHIHSAIKNDQLYQPADPTITNFIETLYFHLVETLWQDAPLVFAELEKKALYGEKILNQQEDETIHISSLLDIIRALGVKSISFNKGSEKEKLQIFINLLTKKPKAVHDEVGLPRLVEENNTAHIDPDNKLHEPVEREPEIVSGPDIAEEPIHESITGVETEKAQEIVSGPDSVEGKISENIAEMEKIFRRLNIMHGAIEALPSEEQRDMIKRSSMQAAEWIEKETAVTPAYKEICRRLQILLQDFISNRFFEEANSIMDVFSKINTGALKKDDEVLGVSLGVLRNLASENNIKILFKEDNINERNKTPRYALHILAGFGNVIISKLLNIIQESNDSKERISVIHVIEEMGHIAIPAIKESITTYAPWYYLRNLAYILGRIGNETSADILKSLLLHKDKRVRKEAFKSLGLTGGNKRGPLLLSVLPEVDQELRINIIEMLGKVRCTEAVNDLLDMFKTKTSLAKGEQISLQEKICNALGAIGSPGAIKTLSEVAESKSFLGIQSYPEEVKNAAKRALEEIKRKQA